MSIARYFGEISKLIGVPCVNYLKPKTLSSLLSVMQFIKILALSLLLTSGIKASAAVETALPLPTVVPLETSIMSSNDGQTNGAMRKFALACGLLAFTAAAQQALFPRKPVLARVNSTRD